MTAPATVHNDIRAMLLDAAGLSVDRLPMLGVILDRLASGCADEFRRFASVEAACSLRAVASGRTGEVLQAYEGRAIAGLLHAPGWEGQIVVGFDRAFVSTMVDALFGGDGTEPELADNLPFSSLETRVARLMFEQVAKALQSAFAPVGDSPFKLERVETRMDAAAPGRGGDAAVVARLPLQAIGRGGEMFVVIPHSALMPMRQTLSRVVKADAIAQDPAWVRQIQSEVQRTGVSLRAILEERQVTLGEIADLQVGQILKLQATPTSRVKLESHDQPLFWCQLGQSDGGYKLRIEDVFDHQQEFVNDVLCR